MYINHVSTIYNNVKRCVQIIRILGLFFWLKPFLLTPLLLQHSEKWVKCGYYWKFYTCLKKKSIIFSNTSDKPDSLANIGQNKESQNRTFFLIFSQSPPFSPRLQFRVSIRKLSFCGILHIGHYLWIYFAELHRVIRSIPQD